MNEKRDTKDAERGRGKRQREAEKAEGNVKRRKRINMEGRKGGRKEGGKGEGGEGGTSTTSILKEGSGPFTLKP